MSHKVNTESCESLNAKSGGLCHVAAVAACVVVLWSCDSRDPFGFLELLKRFYQLVVKSGDEFTASVCAVIARWHWTHLSVLIKVMLRGAA